MERAFEKTESVAGGMSGAEKAAHNAYLPRLVTG